METKDTDERMYAVVMNDEEQYSIWLGGKPLPTGWREVGKSGTKQECLNYIEEVWTDITPLSVRQRLKVDQTQR
jgi:MbtH protein